MTIRTKIEGEWEDIPSPEGLTEIMEAMKDFAGTETVVKLETSCMECYLCGTDALAETMRNVKKDKICWTLAEAHKMIDAAPEEFFTVVQIMSTKKDVADLFPDNPAYNKRGWEHLKEK